MPSGPTRSSSRSTRRTQGCLGSLPASRKRESRAVVDAGVAHLRAADPVLAAVIEQVAGRGIGTWSAHMFLMFHLQRPDVLPVGDLGIRRAVMVRYELLALPDPATMERIAEPWRPYRTLACRFLWRSMAATPV